MPGPSPAPVPPPVPGRGTPIGVVDRKAALRREILADRRRALADGTDPSRDEAAWRSAVTDLVLERTAPGEVVAAYLPTPAEPPLDPALEAVVGAGRRILVPRVQGPHRLEWVCWTPGAEVATSAFGVREPTGPGRGPEAFREAALRLVPALAADRTGVRLGYGGGFYDAALTGAPDGVAVVFSREVLPAGRVPAEPHDARLTEAVTERGALRLAGGSDR